MQHLQPNTTLQGGKYRIERVLGQGGFGITYLAMQTSLQRKVAIKEFFMKDFCSRDDATSTMLGSSTGSNKLVEQYKKKFVKEARNLARLNHPNIINVIDVFEENDTVYYAMPYLSGGSLQDYVKSHGALSETEAMKYVRQIAKALKYMHEEQHMCHYDVKPANILLDDKGDAVLIDFGISKGYDEGGHETSTTPIGLSEGYAPIEQYQQGLEEFSPASDVYALGATLYFLLNGKRPVSAIHRASGTALLMSKHLSQGVKDIIRASMKIPILERAYNVDVFLNNDKTDKLQDDDETVSEDVIKDKASLLKLELEKKSYKKGTFITLVFMIVGFLFGKLNPFFDIPLDIFDIVVCVILGGLIGWLICAFAINWDKETQKEIKRWKKNNSQDPRNRYL
jgi:serine/threonine protein kinase